MTLRDVPEVAELHLRLFRDTPALLGRRFLREFYRLNLGEIALVATINGRVVGFHLTFAGERSSSRTLLRRGGLRLGLAALPALLRQPNLQRRLASSMLNRMRSSDVTKALSLYTAVSEEAQGRGFAKAMLRRMVIDAAARRVRTIEGEQEDDARLWGLYEGIGFRPTGEVRRSGHGTVMPVLLDVEHAARQLT